ncbi:MAG TPA: transposase [Burkholderiales bacterium]|nr:transposase [Burkholderiales bacterium]
MHVIQRGNNRQACFFAEDDYRFFLDHLAKLSKRFHCSLHAYVLMTNHFHLLLSSDLPNAPSLLMKFLGQRYVQYIHGVYRRSGTLWEGRFRSCLAQAEDYVLTCCRCILSAEITEAHGIRERLIVSGVSLQRQSNYKLRQEEKNVQINVIHRRCENRLTLSFTIAAGRMPDHACRHDVGAKGRLLHDQRQRASALHRSRQG